MVVIDKFDPNFLLININKLKCYWFQNTTTSKGLESTINIEMGFHSTTLENAQSTSKQISFSIDITKIHEPQFGTENQDSIVGTKIKDTLAWTINKENPTSTKISTIGSWTKNEVDPIGIEILTTWSKLKLGC